MKPSIYFSCLKVLLLVYYFTKISCCEQTQTSMNGDTNLSKWQSCANKCGKRRVGCSCHVTCLVFKNCCEDFSKHCNDVDPETLSLYQTQLDSEVSCVKENVFLITSCPARNFSTSLEDLIPTPQVLLSLDSGDTTCWTKTIQFYKSLQERLSGLQDIDLFRNSTLQDLHNPLWIVLKAMSSLYVTDRSTGFVYANLDVFVCHATSTSVPCVWELYTPRSPVPLRVVKEHSGQDFFYSSSQLPIPEEKTHTCWHNARDDCDEQSSFYTDLRSRRCKSFTSLVQSFPFFVFKNRFCLQCIRGKNYYKSVSVSDGDRKEFALSAVLIHFEKNGVSLTSQSKSKLDRQMWASAFCQLVPGMPCRLTKCRDGSTQRPDGACRQYYTLHMAVHLRDSKLNQIKHRKLANLLRCLATKYIDLDIDSETLLNLTTFKLGANTFMQGVGIGLYSSMYGIKWRDIETFALWYGNAVLHIINLQEVSTPELDGVKYKHHMIEVSVESYHNNLAVYNTDFDVTSINQSSPGDLLPFCVGVDFKMRDGNFSLPCYPPKEEHVPQLLNDSCLAEYHTEHNSSDAVTCVNVCPSTLVFISLMISHFWFAAGLRENWFNNVPI